MTSAIWSVSALSFGTVEASLNKITPSMDGAARSWAILRSARSGKSILLIAAAC